MVKSLTGADMSVGRVDYKQRKKIRNKDGLLSHYTRLIKAIMHISNGLCIYCKGFLYNYMFMFV